MCNYATAAANYSSFFRVRNYRRRIIVTYYEANKINRIEKRQSFTVFLGFSNSIFFLIYFFTLNGVSMQSS